MLTNLKPLIDYSFGNSTAVAAINSFGYEDAMAAVEAAENRNQPLILSASRDLIGFIPLEAVGKMFVHLAENAKTRICVHLDHCDSETTIRKALDCGFTSVMYDGSHLPLAENIAGTRSVVERAKKYDATVEGEIGSVSYTKGRDHVRHELTDADHAKRFFEESGVDVMAVSIGNVHRLESQTSVVDFSLLREIGARTRAPICIHGASGIPDRDIARLAKETDAVKFNVATRFRRAWGTGLRDLMELEPETFDRIELMSKLHPRLVGEIESFLSVLTPENS